MPVMSSFVCPITIPLPPLPHACNWTMAPNQQWSERTEDKGVQGLLAISPEGQLGIRSNFTPFGKIFGCVWLVSQQVVAANREKMRRDGSCIIITLSKRFLGGVLPYPVHVQI